MIEGWSAYPLWGYREYGYNQDVAGTSHHMAEIRSVLGDDFAGRWARIERVAELIPEPDNPHDRYAVSIRIGNILVGYLPRDVAMTYARPLQELLQRHQVPTAKIEITAHEEQQWDGDYDKPPILVFRADARLQLAEPHLITPINDPPVEDFTLLPFGYSIQVTRCEQHFDVLSDYLQPSGESWIVVTLHDLDVSTAKLTRHVAEIRLDGKRIGQLTPATSLKYLPAVEHFARRGLVVAARAVIRGSAVAATVSMFADKAYELTDDVLNGPALTLPAIHGTQTAAGPPHLAAESSATAASRFEPASPISGRTGEGSTYTITETAAGVSVVRVNFLRPLTPWQTKEAERVVDAATSKLIRAGLPSGAAELSPGSLSFPATSEDAARAIEAIAAVEESDFDAAKRYLLRH